MAPHTRRDLLKDGAALSAALALPATPALAQTSSALPVASAAEVRRAIEAFTQGAKPREEGLLLDLPALADNPAAVPVRVAVTQPITEQRWCREIALITEKNPVPLACTLRFTAATGTAEAAVRLRLSQSQTVHALARMSDGQVLHAQKSVTAAASGCGM